MERSHYFAVIGDENRDRAEPVETGVIDELLFLGKRLVATKGKDGGGKRERSEDDESFQGNLL